MPQYMLSVHTAMGEPREPMTDEQQREGFARIAAIEADMEAAGAFVFSARLSEPSEAKGRPTRPGPAEADRRPIRRDQRSDRRLLPRSRHPRIEVAMVLGIALSAMRSATQAMGGAWIDRRDDGPYRDTRG